MHYSAYVPCFNNEASIRLAVESVLKQTVAPQEVIVVDDGSSDGSVDCLAGLPVRIVRHGRNLGRGAARARAMEESRHEFVLSCDATNVLSAEFAQRASARFVRREVVAVFGQIDQREGKGAVQRWRGRHLFKLGAADRAVAGVVRGASFTTSGAMVRREAVLTVGNYDAHLRHSEDSDLGGRFAAAGWEVFYDPSLRMYSVVHNSLAEVLERYWRWHAGKDERVTWTGYAKNINYSLSVALRESADPAVAAITLLCPHFCFWRSLRRNRRRKA